MLRRPARLLLLPLILCGGCLACSLPPEPADCPAARIAFTQDEGCLNDGSFEFCIPADDPDAQAAVRVIAPAAACVQASGRARCDPTTERLCLVSTQGMCQAQSRGAMTDEGWRTVCALASLPFVRAVVPTWYE